MRTQTHIIDTKAVKMVFKSLPDCWIVRELTERDYGIDLLVEIFVPGLTDAKGKDAYDSSGAVFHIQIKGTEEEVKPVKAGTVNYSIDKKSLSYIEKFSVPFFLFRVDVSSTSGQIYFIWIQRYIKDVLDAETPFWREEPENNITVRIPIQNTVETNFTKIEQISFRPKYIEELVEYNEIFNEIDNQISAIFHGQHTCDINVVTYIKNKAYRILRLNVLLSQNNCCIDQSCVNDLISFLDCLIDNKTELKDYPHSFNFRMLAESLNGLSDIENFVLANDGLLAY